MRSLRSSVFFALALALATLTGCSTPSVVLYEKVDPTAVALDQAISKKAAQKPVGPEVVVAQPTYGERVTVSFLGDAATLLGDAVKGRGGASSFVITGPQPRLPIYVQVHVKDAPFKDFLAEVATQLGQRADIAMNGPVVELRYRALY